MLWAFLYGESEDVVIGFYTVIYEERTQLYQRADTVFLSGDFDTGSAECYDMDYLVDIQECG